LGHWSWFFVRHPAAYSTEQALLLGIAFLLICGGASVFGILTANGAIRLGHASYGVYLLQGFVFSLGFDHPMVKPLVTADTVSFWLVTIVGMLALSIVAACIYAVLERPMIALGRKLGGQASSPISVRIGRARSKAQ
jgi:peptidoglycan/LPS O-acetylase OafA/YrhL